MAQYGPGRRGARAQMVAVAKRMVCINPLPTSPPPINTSVRIPAPRKASKYRKDGGIKHKTLKSIARRISCFRDERRQAEQEFHAEQILTADNIQTFFGKPARPGNIQSGDHRVSETPVSVKPTVSLPVDVHLQAVSGPSEHEIKASTAGIRDRRRRTSGERQLPDALRIIVPPQGATPGRFATPGPSWRPSPQSPNQRPPYLYGAQYSSVSGSFTPLSPLPAQLSFEARYSAVPEPSSPFFTPPLEASPYAPRAPPTSIEYEPVERSVGQSSGLKLVTTPDRATEKSSSVDSCSSLPSGSNEQAELLPPQLDGTSDLDTRKKSSVEEPAELKKKVEKLRQRVEELKELERNADELKKAKELEELKRKAKELEELKIKYSMMQRHNTDLEDALKSAVYQSVAPNPSASPSPRSPMSSFPRPTLYRPRSGHQLRELVLVPREQDQDNAGEGRVDQSQSRPV